MKLTIKFLFILSLLAIQSACSSFTQSTELQKKRFVINNFWTQEVLAKANYEFRKINRMSPVIYKNSIVVGNAIDGLSSYDLDSKNLIWRRQIPYGVEASAASIKDRIFVGANNGKMYAIDLSNGEIIWEFETKSELVSEPLLAEGVLYFLSGSQSLYAVDASSGKQIWIHNRQDTSNQMTVRGGSKPSISNGTVYVGFSDGSVVAFNSKTGTPQWEITLNRNSKFKDIDSTPLVDGSFLYVNSYDDKLYCLSKDKGEVIWSSDFGGANTPLISGDKIFISSSKGDLAALSKKDGALLWKKTTKNGIFTEPVLFSNLIITGESLGSLLFLNSDNGDSVGSFEPGRGVFSKPTVYAEEIYFISGEGNIYGITAKYNNRSSIYYLK